MPLTADEQLDILILAAATAREEALQREKRDQQSQLQRVQALSRRQQEIDNVERERTRSRSREKLEKEIRERTEREQTRPLARGWQFRFSRTHGDRYYIQPSTGHTQWEKPT